MARHMRFYIAPNIPSLPGRLAPQPKGGWVGVKVVCDSVSEVSEFSDGHEQGRKRKGDLAE